MIQAFVRSVEAAIVSVLDRLARSITAASRWLVNGVRVAQDAIRRWF